MDNPALAPKEHLAALVGLRRLNRLGGAAAPIWKEVRRTASDRTRPITLLDVACGAGDLAVGLAVRARKLGLNIDPMACDVSLRALDLAASSAASARVELATLRHDLFDGPIPASADVVTCTLFMHHLDPPDVIRVLRSMHAATRRLLLVSDLRRTRLGLAMAYLVPRVVTRSRVVRIDAVKSVRGAYSIEEFADLARRAGLEGCRIRAIWPQRMLLRWERRA